MKRRRILLFLLCSVAAVTLAIFVWPREREPEYNGLTISKWLDRWANGHSEGFVFAVSEIGTNATPFLLGAVGYKQPRWKAWLVGSIRYWPDPLVSSPCADWLINNKAEIRAQAALVGFAALGRKAQPVLPELRRLANSKDPDLSRRALTCLMVITNRVELDTLLKLRR